MSLEALLNISVDLDFGQLAFQDIQPHAGVILLRLRINNPRMHIRALKAFLSSRTESEIKGKFWSLDERIFMA